MDDDAVDRVPTDPPQGPGPPDAVAPPGVVVPDADPVHPTAAAAPPLGTEHLRPVAPDGPRRAVYGIAVGVAAGLLASAGLDRGRRRSRR